jgi:hypothetical protein
MPLDVSTDLSKTTQAPHRIKSESGWKLSQLTSLKWLHKNPDSPDSSELQLRLYADMKKISMCYQQMDSENALFILH